MFPKKCKYSIDGCHVIIAEKDEIHEIPDELAERLCGNKLCSPVIEKKEEPKKRESKKEKSKPVKEDDFLS